MDEVTAKKVFEMISTQTFYDWYEGEYKDWLCGDTDTPQEKLIKDLQDMCAS